MCSLQCDGFGQKDPTDPSTYALPYKTFDLSSITRIEDLPVFEYGCDSSYSWSARYKHLVQSKTPEEICDELQNVLKHPSNPEGLFLHPRTKQWHHLAFTGGEPMMKQSQQATVAILQEFYERDNYPHYVTVETNGTTKITEDLLDWIKNIHHYEMGANWFWSCSPKLFTTSGEKPKKAIHPDVVAGYAHTFDHGQLKYVVNGSEQTWDEVEKVTEQFRQSGVNWDVWIMAVGATKESQETTSTANIAMEAIKRGYNFSGRLHSHVFSNKIGT